MLLSGIWTLLKMYLIILEIYIRIYQISIIEVISTCSTSQIQNETLNIGGAIKLRQVINLDLVTIKINFNKMIFMWFNLKLLQDPEQTIIIKIYTYPSLSYSFRYSLSRYFIYLSTLCTKSVVVQCSPQPGSDNIFNLSRDCIRGRFDHQLWCADNKAKKLY